MKKKAFSEADVAEQESRDDFPWALADSLWREGIPFGQMSDVEILALVMENLPDLDSEEAAEVVRHLRALPSLESLQGVGHPETGAIPF